jgi:hypothetical protein
MAASEIIMDKPGRNDPCTCGSGKKYKKCCLNKKQREYTIDIASPEPLHGFYFDKEKMELTGLTLDDRLIKPFMTILKSTINQSRGRKKLFLVYKIRLFQMNKNS